jgi:F1F0 ATPase subunit 2
MAETSYLILTFIAGMALGTFFSLNLWYSVRRMADEHTPWYVMYGNFMLRIGVVIVGLYLVMAGHWERMLTAMLGFVIMREILVRRLGRKPTML